jgi:hypothetical protein
LTQHPICLLEVFTIPSKLNNVFRKVLT